MGVLEKFVPGTDVRAFGQRVCGTARRHSDLELVIMTKQPLEAPLLADLKAAFMASSLPFSVVALDWAALEDRTRRDIEVESVLIRKAALPA
ncbi:MAG: nucleotidyltransferase domain-containing protein [Candidatus Aminicenantes bacterium]|jgi:type I restriction enzyme S subunit|nr:nucleotidyltransferase domain-containing protein [Candidatus Aminicenantes bacterium]